MLQLVDISLVHLKGVLKDVLIKVWGFIIHVNFIVLDFEEDWDTPILLGRPFLATSIDLEKNELIMKIDDETEVFKCSHDSQSEGSVRKECYTLFNLIPNNLDQRYSSSCDGASKWIA